MHNIHIRSISKNTQTCLNKENAHILFYEQAVYERGEKTVKVLHEFFVRSYACGPYISMTRWYKVHYGDWRQSISSGQGTEIIKKHVLTFKEHGRKGTDMDYGIILRPTDIHYPRETIIYYLFTIFVFEIWRFSQFTNSMERISGCQSLVSIKKYLSKLTFKVYYLLSGKKYLLSPFNFAVNLSTLYWNINHVFWQNVIIYL